MGVRVKEDLYEQELWQAERLIRDVDANSEFRTLTQGRKGANTDRCAFETNLTADQSDAS